MIAISGVTLVLGLGQMILEAIQPIFKIPVNFIDQFQTLKWPITLVALFGDHVYDLLDCTKRAIEI